MPKGMGYKGYPQMSMKTMMSEVKGGSGKKTPVIHGSQYMFGEGYKENAGTHGTGKLMKHHSSMKPY